VKARETCAWRPCGSVDCAEFGSPDCVDRPTSTTPSLAATLRAFADDLTRAPYVYAECETLAIRHIVSTVSRLRELADEIDTGIVLPVNDD